MGAPRTVPSVSAALAEESFAEQPTVELTDLAEGRSLDAPVSVLQFDLPAGNCCCVGVDVPGVGLTHSYGCPRAQHKCLSGCSENVAGEVPKTLRTYVEDPAKAERDGLFSQLLSAAREQAQGRIESLKNGQYVCANCLMSGTWDELQSAAHACGVGRVLGLIKRLCTLAESVANNSTTKEDAPVDEGGRADDGIRLRVLKEQICLKCGTRGGEWIGKGWWGERTFADLALNQFVDVGPNVLNGRGYMLYTHQCKPLRAKSLDVRQCDGSCDNDWCTATPATAAGQQGGAK